MEFERRVDALARGVQELNNITAEVVSITAETRASLAETKSYLAETKSYLAETKSDLAETRVSLAETNKIMAGVHLGIAALKERFGWLDDEVEQYGEEVSLELDDNSIDAIDAGTTVATPQPSNDVSKSKPNFWKRGGKVPLDSDAGDKPARP